MDPDFVSSAPVTQCTFETGFCGWSQDRTDQFDWTRQHGTTSSSNTGPRFDHTTGSAAGRGSNMSHVSYYITIITGLFGFYSRGSLSFRKKLSSFNHYLTC